MINLFLYRKYLGETYTVGKLHIGDDYFCDTLEDKVRDYNKDGDLDEPGETKIYGETAIPYGRYPVTLIWWAKHARVVPWVQKVNNFVGILIHAGTTAKDTLGCILVGKNTAKGMITESRVTERELVRRLKEYMVQGHDIYLNVL